MYGTELPATVTGSRTLARPGRRRGAAVRTRMIGALVAVGVGLGGFGLTACGTAPSTAGYENLSNAGQNPFTPPVGRDDPNVPPLTDGGGERAGDAEALYARDPSAPSCDADALIATLRGDTAKAAAWAKVLGIDVAQIPDFVKSLTPVVLRSDTAVTSYSYLDGTYRAAPAVLATGTAVFVSVYGEPTVKCYSGNPLTRGTSTDPAVTTVTPARTVITRPTYVDPSTGTSHAETHVVPPEQLVAAAHSARALATRAAKEAADARSRADDAKAALAEATKNVRDAEPAVSDAAARVNWLEDQLEGAKHDGSSPSVVTKLEQLLAAGRNDLSTAQGKLDELILVEADRQAQFDERDKAAKDKEGIAKKADAVARTAERVAGLHSPPAWQPTHRPTVAAVAHDERKDDPAVEPDEPKGTDEADETTPQNTDTGQQAATPSSSDATTRPATGDGVSDQQ